MSEIIIEKDDTGKIISVTVKDPLKEIKQELELIKIDLTKIKNKVGA